jgi:D-amino-acid oxidase
MPDPQIVVVGGGVSGLSCAIRLQEFFPVRLVAQHLPPRTTSDTAAAFIYPYKVEPWERVKKWTMVTIAEFRGQMMVKGTGVTTANLLDLFVEESPPPKWAELLDEFRKARPDELPEGFKCGYVLSVPKVETPIYMPYLVNRFQDDGGIVERCERALELSELCKPNTIVVNCTGIGARDFCKDEKVFPIRGQVSSVGPTLSETIYICEEPVLTYIVPRSADCIIGGTAEVGNWDLEPDLETSMKIFHRCSNILKELNLRTEVRSHIVGLRPGRFEVRLETEKISDNCTVVHNYGHGGAGFTLSWGCADEVLRIILDLVKT